MYAFMYANSNKIPVEYYFTATKTFLRLTIKCQLHDQSQKIGFYLVTYVQNIMT